MTAPLFDGFCPHGEPPNAADPCPNLVAVPSGPIVAGIDLSMTSSGVAIYNPHMPGGPRALHRVRSKGEKAPTLEQRGLRIAGLAAKIVETVQWANLVVIEQPAYSSGGMAGSHDTSGLWWSVVSAFLAAGVPVAEVPPSTRARYAVGYADKKRAKGVPAPDASKDAVLAAVINRFPDWTVTGNDVADALLLAAMGCDHLGHPIVDMPQLHRKALAAVAWPEVTR